MYEDPPRGPGLVGGPFLRSGMGRGTLPEVHGGSGDLREVRNMSGNLPEVWDGSGDPQGGPELVRGSDRRSGMGRGTLPVVWNRSGFPPGGLGRVG